MRQGSHHAGRLGGEGHACLQEPDVDEITRCMVGRSVDLSAAPARFGISSDARTIMSIRKLWVDMPGEIGPQCESGCQGGRDSGYRRSGRSGQAGYSQRRHGACMRPGGTVEFDGKPIPLNNPRKCLDAQLGLRVGGPPRRGPAAGRDSGVERGVPGHADPEQVPEEISAPDHLAR